MAGVTRVTMSAADTSRWTRASQSGALCALLAPAAVAPISHVAKLRHRQAGVTTPQYPARDSGVFQARRAAPLSSFCKV